MYLVEVPFVVGEVGVVKVRNLMDRPSDVRPPFCRS